MEILDAISNVGFTAAVSAFALWMSYKHIEYLQNTLHDTIAGNTEALEKLRETIAKLTLRGDDQ